MKAAFVFAAVAAMLVGCASVPTEIPASYLSKSLGSNMDSSDHARANEALESGSEDRPYSWVNPISRKRFTVTPTDTLKIGGKDCRKYEAIYGGRQVTGTACRLENGTWLER